MEKDWTYILEDSDAKVLIVATEAIYEKVKNYPGKVSSYITSISLFLTHFETFFVDSDRESGKHYLSGCLG